MSSLPDRGKHIEAQALPLPREEQSQTGDSRGFQEVGTKSKNIEEGVEVAMRYCCASSRRKPMDRGHFSLRQWESEMHKSWCMPVEAARAMLLPMAPC